MRAVDADVPCARCEYNVRSLPRDGRCPECGEPVAASLHRHAAMLRRGGAPLSMSSPRWVRRLSLGCWLVLLGGAGMAADTGLKLAGVGLASRTIAMTLWLVPHLLGATGLWLLGTPEARGGSRADRVLPTLIRAAAVSQAAGLPALLAALLLTLPANVVLYGRQAMFLLALLAAGGSAGAFGYLARLASRMSRPRLRRWAIGLAITTPAASLVQAWFFFDFAVRANHVWIPTPQAVLVSPQMWALLPYRLIRWRGADLALVFWVVLVAMSILCAAVLAAYAVSLRAAAAAAAVGGGGDVVPGAGAIPTPSAAARAAPTSPPAP